MTKLNIFWKVLVFGTLGAAWTGHVSAGVVGSKHDLTAGGGAQATTTVLHADRVVVCQVRAKRGYRCTDHDADTDEQDDRRVDQRSQQLTSQRGGLFQIDGQAPEDDVQDTARLAGGDQVAKQVVEHPGVTAHRLG